MRLLRFTVAALAFGPVEGGGGGTESNRQQQQPVPPPTDDSQNHHKVSKEAKEAQKKGKELQEQWSQPAEAKKWWDKVIECSKIPVYRAFVKYVGTPSVEHNSPSFGDWLQNGKGAFVHQFVKYDVLAKEWITEHKWRSTHGSLSMGEDGKENVRVANNADDFPKLIGSFRANIGTVRGEVDACVTPPDVEEEGGFYEGLIKYLREKVKFNVYTAAEELYKLVAEKDKQIGGQTATEKSNTLKAGRGVLETLQNNAKNWLNQYSYDAQLKSLKLFLEKFSVGKDVDELDAKVKVQTLFYTVDDFRKEMSKIHHNFLSVMVSNAEFPTLIKEDVMPALKEVKDPLQHFATFVSAVEKRAKARVCHNPFLTPGRKGKDPDQPEEIKKTLALCLATVDGIAKMVLAVEQQVMEKGRMAEALQYFQNVQAPRKAAVHVSASGKDAQQIPSELNPVSKPHKKKEDL